MPLLQIVLQIVLYYIHLFLDPDLYPAVVRQLIAETVQCAHCCALGLLA
jgi:hypothetical protein